LRLILFYRSDFSYERIPSYGGNAIGFRILDWNCQERDEEISIESGGLPEFKIYLEEAEKSLTAPWIAMCL
jgi:hypothetical protein